MTSDQPQRDAETNKSTTQNANAALETLMRAGYAARGAVYILVGGIAIYAAIGGGGEAEGSSSALASLENAPLGRVLLAAIAAGLFAYAAWRFIDGLVDLEGKGDDGEGYISRAGQLISGGVHMVLAVTAASLAFGGGDGSGSSGGSDDSRVETLASVLVDNPVGRAVIIVAGLVTFGVGFYMAFKAKKAAYKEKIRLTPTTERLAPAIRFGLAAHGFVLLLIGGFIAWAGVSADPDKAAGLGEVLRMLEAQAFGRTILAVTGAGLLGFSVYCLVIAKYRIAPGLDRSDMPDTLASR